jgi:uncharacterized protein YjbI with pentapeptide repeats
VVKVSTLTGARMIIEIRITHNNEGDIETIKEWTTVTLAEAKEAYRNSGCDVDFKIDGELVRYLGYDGRILRDNLKECDLSRVNLRGADLRGCDFNGAYLRWADLRGCDLRGANLRWTDLRGCDLRGANLELADLSFAKFRKEDGDETTIWPYPWTFDKWPHAK